MNNHALLLSAITLIASFTVFGNIPHPRPQMMRENFTMLDGQWDYAIVKSSDDLETLAGPIVGQKKFDGKINVPYALESEASGVKRLLENDETLWYSRSFTVSEKTYNNLGHHRLILHFEAVDYRAQVFINGIESALPHEGMYDSIDIDITPHVKKGVNLLQLAVWDPTGRNAYGAVGRQLLTPRGETHIRSSGIWQSVWMEEVPETYLKSYRVNTSIKENKVSFSLSVKGETLNLDGEITIFASTEFTHPIATAKITSLSKPTIITLPEEIKTWSPNSPHLYGVKIKIGDDIVSGYFGARSFELIRDVNNTARFALNGEITYLLGVNDAGIWPNTILTPKSEKQIIDEINFLKRAGFNMIRKHGKIEPLSYYALCDKLGIMVVQDMPAGKGDSIGRYAFYRDELKRNVDRLINIPSIVMWSPYNEGWGQPPAKLTHDTLMWLKKYDSSRLVSGPSGWNDYEGGLSHHGYYIEDWGVKPRDHVEFASHAIAMHVPEGVGMFRANPDRASFLAKFGGITPISEFNYRYTELAEAIAELARRGLSGSAYDRLTDYGEVSGGLLSPDRAKILVDVEKLKRANSTILSAVQESLSPRTTLTLIPKLAPRANTWAWTVKKPSGNWTKPNYDDSTWGRSAGGFGNNYILNLHPNAVHSIEWVTSELFLRCSFDMPKGAELIDSYVEMFHDEDVEIYLNGRHILSVAGSNVKWDTFVIDRDTFASAVKPGKNVLAVYVRQTAGGQYFDLGLYADIAK